MANKTVAATSAKKVKKVSAPKPAKVAKPKKKDGVIDMKADTRFVSFAVRAVIPVQSFGNIQPEITVEAPTFEEARDFAMPHIEELYGKYAEVKPGFLGKVNETVKVVSASDGAPVQAPKSPLTAPGKSQASEMSSQGVPAPAEANSGVAEGPKPESVLRAERAIERASSDMAALAIQDQIEKSVKIPPAYKPALITLVLEKRGTFK